MRNEVGTGGVACTAGSPEGFGEEEVLHIDDDEGGFGGGDGDGDGGGLYGGFWGGDGGGWGVGVGEVEAVGGVVEPEVGGLADERFAGWRGRLGSGTHVVFVSMLSGSPGMQWRDLS